MKGHREWLPRYLWASGGAILLALGWILSEAWGQYRELGMVSGYLLLAIGAGGVSVVATPIAARAVAAYVARRRSVSEGSPLFPWVLAYHRAVFFLFFGMVLAALFGRRSEQSYHLAAVLLTAAGVHRLALCAPAAVQAATAWLRDSRVGRTLDFVATTAVATVLFGELFLHAYLVASGNTGMLASGPDAFANKLKAAIFGFAPNQLGYNDREFDRRKPAGRVRVAAVGDSFFVGHVPRPYGVMARTEELLREKRGGTIELYNFGINATGPPEYVQILQRDALRFDPDVILVGIYVGNDITEPYPHATPLGKDWYALYRLSRQVAQWWRTRKAREGFVDITKITRTDREYWYSREVPAVHSEEHYLDIATRHLEKCRPPTSARGETAWASALGALSEMKVTCDHAGATLLVVLSPDHVQVSPRLRGEIAAKRGIDLARYTLEYPQHRFLEHCKREGIPCLDLLPAFREAAGSVDPDHLYLLQDTHWSARGNEVAAEALAAWLAEVLP